MPRIMRLMRLGHKRKDIDDIYSHITEQMIENTLTVWGSNTRCSVLTCGLCVPVGHG